MKIADLYCFALGCLLFGWLLHRDRDEDELDPVARLRLAGAI